MRKLIVAIVLLALVGCASAPKSAPGVKQVEPLSEVVVVSCGKFLGAVIVLPDGTLETTQDKAAAKAVYDAMKDGHAAVVEAAEDCSPKQST